MICDKSRRENRTLGCARIVEDTQSCDSFKKLRKANDNKFWTSIFEEFGLVLHDFGDLESVKPKGSRSSVSLWWRAGHLHRSRVSSQSTELGRGADGRKWWVERRRLFDLCVGAYKKG